jgi:hypothetical protein
LAVEKIPNLDAIPSRTSVDTSIRWAFKISKALANLRERASNVPNAAGFDLQEAGPYDLIDGKWVTLESEDVRPPKPARVGYALKTWRERPLS